MTTPREIDVRPGDRTSLIVDTEVGGVGVSIRLRWYPRPRAWCMDIVDSADAPLSIPQLVRPGASHIHDTRDSRLPDGVFTWVGPDDYGRADLGESLRLIYEPATPEVRPDVNTLLRVDP